MTQVCLPAGCIDAARFAIVDDCTDAPIAGMSNGYIVNCLRNLTVTANVEEGEETVLENDCGKKCWITRKCDEMRNLTLEFEILNPDYELTNLLTGQVLINDGTENIGYYWNEGQPCHPWISVELFEQVPDESCIVGHRYRRLILPKLRFQPPTFEREDPFRIVKWIGTTSPAQLASWGDGPYNDSPFDFSAVAAGVQTQYIELFDDTITGTLTGQCGFVEVPGQAGFSGIFLGDVANAGDTGQFESTSVQIINAANGGYYVAGNVAVAGQSRSAVYKFTAAGDPDPTWGGGDGLTITPLVGANDEISNSIQEYADGSVLVSATDNPTFPGAKAYAYKLTPTGVLDVTFATAGIFPAHLSFVGDTAATPRGLFLQANEDFDFTYVEGSTFTSFVHRFSSGNAPASTGDVSSLPYVINDIGRRVDALGVPLDDEYVMSMQDINTGDVYAGYAQPSTATGNTSASGVGASPTGNIFSSENGVNADVDGSFYIAGSNPSGLARVVKVTAFNSLTLDPSFGVAGVLDVAHDVNDSIAVLHDVIVLTGGDIIVSGHANDGVTGDTLWFTGRYDSTGTIVPSYGTSGFQDYVFGEAGPTYFSALFDSNLDGTRLVHTGISYNFTNSAYLLAVGRTFASTGALDPSFGA